GLERAAGQGAAPAARPAGRRQRRWRQRQNERRAQALVRSGEPRLGRLGRPAVTRARRGGGAGPGGRAGGGAGCGLALLSNGARIQSAFTYVATLCELSFWWSSRVGSARRFGRPRARQRG